MSVINTNVLSLTAQNNLDKSQSALGTAIERLSSGLKINSAKDDAAGQAIANRFTANIKGLDKARSNANDGISLAQTTEGALKEITNNLQRIRELTVQAANGTNSASDRASIQDEIRLRLDEIDRVSAQTQFNGTTVLAKDQALQIQVGANDGETISITMGDISSKTLSLNGFNVEKQAVLKTVDGPAYVSNGKALDTSGMAAAVTAIAPGGATDGKVFVDQADGKSYVEVTGATDATKNGFYSVSVDASTGKVTAPTFKGAAAPGKLEEITEVQVKPTVPAGHKLVSLTNEKGATVGMALQETASGKLYAYDEAVQGKPTLKTVGYTDATGAPQTAAVELGGVDGLTETVKTATGTFKAADLKGANLATADLRTVETPTKDPLALLDKALSKVDKLSSDLGAVQNRLQSTIANLSNTTVNLQAARSRIQDANYATEVSNMGRSQIIQQAGTAVLAQANQVAQGVLSLLR
jgi:flagellin